MWEKKSGIWMSLFIVGMIAGFCCFLMWMENTYKIEMKIQEEEQKKYQEQLETKVIAVVEDYAKNLEQKLRKAGMEGVEVICTQCSQEEYEELFYYSPPFRQKKYTYYFKMEYQSDEMASICDEYIRMRKRIDLCKLLKECCSVKNQYRFESENTSGVFDINEEEVDIYINDGMFDSELLFHTSDGQTYEFSGFGADMSVYKNDICMVNIEKATSNSKPERSPSSSSSYQPYIVYDPYDVYDYADGDEFADEWAEEFGDGDYDEGYEEAYDYWENGY